MGKGRPPKKGAEWFPHDTSASDRKTIHILEAKFGNDGYAFWFKMLENLGCSDGYFIDCNREEDWLLLVDKARVSEEKANQILDLMARVEAIDKKLWQDHRIIWSQNFVDRLYVLFNRRTSGIPQRPSFDLKRMPDRSDEGADAPKAEQNAQKAEQNAQFAGFSGLGDMLDDSDYERMREAEKLEDVWRMAGGGSGFTMLEDGEICKLLSQYSADEIGAAIVKAGEMRKVNIGYVKGILRNGGARDAAVNRGGGDRSSQGGRCDGRAGEQGTRFDPRYEGEVF